MVRPLLYTSLVRTLTLIPWLLLVACHRAPPGYTRTLVATDQGGVRALCEDTRLPFAGEHPIFTFQLLELDAAGLITSWTDAERFALVSTNDPEARPDGYNIPADGDTIEIRKHYDKPDYWISVTRIGAAPWELILPELQTPHAATRLDHGAFFLGSFDGRDYIITKITAGGATLWTTPLR